MKAAVIVEWIMEKTYLTVKYYTSSLNPFTCKVQIPLGPNFRVRLYSSLYILKSGIVENR